jgi:hypothetical protein
MSWTVEAIDIITAPLPHKDKLEIVSSLIGGLDGPKP